MYKISSAIEKNRLYITLGDLRTNEIKPIMTELNTHIATLSKKFTCLVDIREMKLDKEGQVSEYIEIIQGALFDAGMGRVVRVLDKENITPSIKMEKGSKAVGYNFESAYSIEEAEALFEK